MIKNLSRIEHKIGEKVYQFFCDMDAPAQDVYNALSIMRTHVAGIISESKPSNESVCEENKKE